MIQEIKNGESVITIDTERKYSAMPNAEGEEKEMRKLLGLPIKKQLVYYKDKKSAGSIINAKAYQILEIYEITDRWFTIDLFLEDDTVIRIHSWYLAEMQKASFIEDMVTQEA